MKIKWKNIGVLLLVFFAVFIWIRAGPEILEFLSAIPKVEPSGNSDDRTFGLMGFGLICVTIAAITKILVSHK